MHKAGMGCGTHSAKPPLPPRKSMDARVVLYALSVQVSTCPEPCIEGLQQP
jgi:hypothetical protein